MGVTDPLDHILDGIPDPLTGMLHSERAVASQAAIDFPHEFMAVRAMIAGATRLLDGIAWAADEPGDEPDAEALFVQTAFAARAINSLHCAHTILLAGHYVQTVTLLRAALEDLAVCVWVLDKPEDAPIWTVQALGRPKLRDKKRPTTASQLRNAGAHYGSELTLKGIYDHLSEIAHPRGDGASWSFEVEDSATLKPGPFYNRARTEFCLFFLVGVLCLVLESAGDMRRSVLSEEDRLLDLVGDLMNAAAGLLKPDRFRPPFVDELFRVPLSYFKKRWTEQTEQAD